MGRERYAKNGKPQNILKQVIKIFTEMEKIDRSDIF
jgi:hypothetical protein